MAEVFAYGGRYIYLLQRVRAAIVHAYWRASLFVLSPFQLIAFTDMDS